MHRARCAGVLVLFLAVACDREASHPERAPLAPSVRQLVVEPRAHSDRARLRTAPAQGGDSVPTTAQAEQDSAEGLRENGTTAFVGGAAAWLESRRAQRDIYASPDERLLAKAADRAADWIASQAFKEGGWRLGADVAGESSPDLRPDVSQTGLAIHCILSTGTTHNSGDYKEVVKAALKYLRTVQTESGSFAPNFRDHLQAALAMVEAYGTTMSVVMKDSAQRAVNFIHAAQHENGGWSTTSDGETFIRWERNEDGVWSSTADPETTAESVVVLAVAERCELEVDRVALQKGADALSDAPVTPRTVLARVLATAVAAPDSLLTDFTLRDSCERLLVTLSPDDVEALHLGSLAAFQLGGETWMRWQQAVRRLDLASQRQDGAHRGSWDPLDGSDDPDRRFRGTALRCLAASASWLYPRVVK